MSHDAIVVGGGHNGLSAAAYLARASMLRPRVVADLELKRFGYDPVAVYLPADGLRVLEADA